MKHPLFLIHIAGIVLTTINVTLPKDESIPSSPQQLTTLNYK